MFDQHGDLTNVIIAKFLPFSHSGFTAIGKPAEPLDFEAIDDEPVDLIFMLLAPESAGADHLKALAKVSRLLRDKSICDKLRGSDGVDALYILLTDTQADAA